MGNLFIDYVRNQDLFILIVLFVFFFTNQIQQMRENEMQLCEWQVTQISYTVL